jgi:hypothetical protein
MVAGNAQGAVMGLAIITAIFGGYDTLKPLPTPHGFDEAICVTDEPALAADGWTMIVEPKSDQPRLAAKRPKMVPWLYTSVGRSVWIDGAFQVINDRFAQFVREHLDRNDLVVWQHPEPRNCLYQEADYCQDWPKYCGDPIREMVATYRAAGMPEQFGLYAAGTVGMRHTADVKGFGWAWWDECQRWSIQDQISLPYLLWSRGKTFATWDAHEYQNDMLTYHQHIGRD